MSVCKHDSIIHVMAVEPTAEENGCIEHYACARCGKTFADAQGTTPIGNTILWATDYIVEDLSEIENCLAEFDGDENYMMQILRDCLKTYEGSNYDFTGWENWTEEEWNAFWEYINQLFGGGGDKSQPNTKQVADDDLDPLDLIGDVAGLFLTAISNADVAAANNIDCSIMQLFDENFELHVKLDKMMQQLGNIQQSITNLSNKIEEQVYKNAMQTRYEELSTLYIGTHVYFKQVLDKIQAGHADYSKLMDSIPSFKNEMIELTQRWRTKNGMIGGTNFEIVLQQMLLKYQGGFNTGKTMPEVYDYIAAHAEPWEHKGYKFREMARNIDALVMAECYLMDLVYHDANQITFDYKQQFCELMLEYGTLLNNHKVDRHRDHLVCQINGAHASIKKDMKKLEAYQYLVEHSSEIDVKNNKNMDDFRKYLLPTGSVSPDWYRVVYQYYERIATANGQTIGNNFLYEKLSEIGFNNVPVGFTQYPYGLIIADCTCGWHDPDFTAIGEWENSLFRIYIKDVGSNSDWIGYHTCVTPKEGCTVNGVDIWHMTISNPVVNGRIKDVGEHWGGYNYYALEKYE